MSKKNQQLLFGEKSVADHSKLGEEFERELQATHDWYLKNSIVDVVKVPSAWDFARGQDHYKYKLLYEKGAPNAARLPNGTYLMRVRSEVDFSGGNDRFCFQFDAKATEENNFPFKNVEDNQIYRLKRAAKCGTNAGLMIKFSKFNRVFFAPVAMVAPKFDAWFRQSSGVRSKPGTASLSIAELEAGALEIKQNKFQLWDWYPVLTAGK